MSATTRVRLNTFLLPTAGSAAVAGVAACLDATRAASAPTTTDNSVSTVARWRRMAREATVNNATEEGRRVGMQSICGGSRHKRGGGKRRPHFTIEALWVGRESHTQVSFLFRIVFNLWPAVVLKNVGGC